MKGLFLSVYFSFYTILVRLQLLRSLRASHPMKSLIEFFFSSSGYLATCKKCVSFIPSGDICDQRILQSNWLKAFLAITQGQEFSAKLYDKIGSNINFYLSTFLANINDKIFENKYFGGFFWAYFVAFS